jgi:hypothetical protein
MSYEKEQEKRENLGTHCNLASEHTLTKDTGIGNKHDILGVSPVTAGVFGTIIYQKTLLVVRSGERMRF